MTIAIDATTPAIARVASGNCVSASFTAPANSLLLALYENQNVTANTITDSGGLTWSPVVESTGFGTVAGAKVAFAATSAARTVTMSSVTNIDHKIMQVMVFTGTALIAPFTGATKTGTSTTLMNDSITSTAVGSWAWAMYSDLTGAAVPTPGSGVTVRSSDNSSETGAVLYHTALSGSVGEVDTISTTAPSSVGIVYCIVEILPPPSVATLPDVVMAPRIPR